jgi:DNA-binding transcriptional LysR family regulator
LRLLVKDALFVRAAGGVSPTPKAERLAMAVQSALATVEQALNEAEQFMPAQSRKVFRLHMSDIGEARFLPDLMLALRSLAPGVRLETSPLPASEITHALDSGRIDFAFGFLPTVKDTQREELLSDRYIVLLREGHPFTLRRRSGQSLLDDLRQLEFVAVRTHSDTLRILQMVQLEDRLRLTTEHFMVLPFIVKGTDLGVVMPLNIAKIFAANGGYAIIEPPFPLRDFTVSLHWSRRFEADPGQQWLRQTIVKLFSGKTSGTA